MKDITERLQEIADGRGPGQIRALANDALDEIKSLRLQNVQEIYTIQQLDKAVREAADLITEAQELVAATRAEMAAKKQEREWLQSQYDQDTNSLKCDVEQLGFAIDHLLNAISAKAAPDLMMSAVKHGMQARKEHS